LSDGLVLNCRGKEKVGLDREFTEGNIFEVYVKLVGEEEEEVHKYAATVNPRMKLLNQDTLGDGTTETIEIYYPNIEGITNYYSLDNGETWQEYTDSLDILKTEKEKVLAKLEFNEGKTINVPAIYFKAGIASTHTASTLTYSWEELEKIAHAISDKSTLITRNTAEVTVTLSGVTYTVGVGDLTTVKYGSSSKTVRIMGFNHDVLTNKAAYGGNNTYAGISFEFVSFVISSVMNSSATNVNGWGGSKARSTLNNTTINSLNNKAYIKQVNKQYVKYEGNPSSLTTSSDKLWLLAVSEVFRDGYTGNWQDGAVATTKEGEMYKYYKNINASYRGNSRVIKNSSYWWLRSVVTASNRRDFISIGDDGRTHSSSADCNDGLAPGFSI